MTEAGAGVVQHQRMADEESQHRSAQEPLVVAGRLAGRAYEVGRMGPEVHEVVVRCGGGCDRDVLLVRQRVEERMGRLACRLGQHLAVLRGVQHSWKLLGRRSDQSAAPPECCPHSK